MWKTRSRARNTPATRRNIAKKAEAYLQSTGIADVAYFGPEAEFYVFNDIRYGQSANSAAFMRLTRTKPLGTQVAMRSPT